MRATGTSGMSGSVRIWSTPAPSEKIAFRFGNCFRLPCGCFHTTAYSTVGSAGPFGSLTTSWSPASRRTHCDGSHPVTETRMRPRAELLMKIPRKLLADDALGRGLDVERGSDQRPGVVGLRPLEDLLDRAMFDHLAVAHDDDVV